MSASAAFALAWKEARRTLAHPFVVVAAVLMFAWCTMLGADQLPTWDRIGLYGSAGSAILAGGLLVAVQLNATRDRRSKMLPLRTVLPAGPEVQYGSLLLASAFGGLLGLTVVGLHVLTLLPLGIAGWPDASELLTVAALPILGVCLGVALGRWFPQVAAGPVALFVLGLLIIPLQSWAETSSNVLWLHPVPLQLSGFAAGDAGRPTSWHLLYIVAIAAGVAILTLVRHARSVRAKALLVIGVLAFAGVAAIEPQLVQDRGNPMATRYTGPDAHRCDTYKGVRYCMLKDFRAWTPLLDRAIDPIRSSIPAGVRASLPTVRQLPAAVVFSPSWDPRPGEVRVSADWGRGALGAFHRGELAADVAATVVGLGHQDLKPCAATDQARALVAFWLKAQASRSLNPPFVETSPDETYSIGNARVGLPTSKVVNDLLALPADQVHDRITRHWDVLVDPDTTLEQAAPLLGLRVESVHRHFEGFVPGPFEREFTPCR